MDKNRAESSNTEKKELNWTTVIFWKRKRKLDSKVNTTVSKLTLIFILGKSAQTASVNIFLNIFTIITIILIHKMLF